MSGPSFDDVPASAAPNKSIADSYSYHDQDRSRSPIFSDRDERDRDAAEPASTDSPYKYAKQRWSQDIDEMHRNGRRHGSSELPRLQAGHKLDATEKDNYEPVKEDDPNSYDLVVPGQTEEALQKTWNLEKQSQALFSKEHLQVIFGDPGFLLRFTSFLGLHRPQSVPILVHYLDSLKALRALHYSNAILEGLDEVPGLDFTKDRVELTTNASLLKRAGDAFDYLVREELPAYITYEYIQVVSASITARITGMLAPHLREASEGLAEVFCLTDPSRPDNPIVFASEEFYRTTEYGMSYVLGRNCRFLQGPYTNPLSVRRIRNATESGRQHQEVFLNYRRDGSPFMNLLMTAPLCDSRGVVRYFIGAQVDVSGLVKDCSEMDSLARLLDMQSRNEKVPDHQYPNQEKNDELRELSEMLNQNELSTIRKHGGRMHKENDYDDYDRETNHEEGSVASGQPRILIKDPSTLTPPFDYADPMDNAADESAKPPPPGSITSTNASSLARHSGRLSGIYHHYLLIRPYPSLRILFASPSQRVPGILQSPFMNKIGGSNRVREELTAALADGRGVTAKVRWVSKHDDEGRNKWIHCTPLIGVNGQIGVWMVVIVDDERHRVVRERERGIGIGGGGIGRMAPPVPVPNDHRDRDRDRATPDRHDKHDTTGALRRNSREVVQSTPQRAAPLPSERREKRGASSNGQANITAHRYGYSSGNAGAVLTDRMGAGAGKGKESYNSYATNVNVDGEGSVNSFKI